MRAAVMLEFGPPEVLQVCEVATPSVRKHDILIRVRATSVNFGDTLVRNFAAVTPRTFHMPWLFWLIGKVTFGVWRPRVHVLGSEFAGTSYLAIEAPAWAPTPSTSASPRPVS
jgi:NADPH:quinone reductase-like Zn-dependent oxidoreductase